MNDKHASGVTYLGVTTFRNQRTRFGIRQQDRRSHMYVLGKTGTGKSTLLKSMILQDSRAGVGVAVFDPHGDLARDLVAELHDGCTGRLINFDATAPLPELPAFNPLSGVTPERAPLAVAGLIEVFKKLWVDDWGPRLEHVLRMVLYTLVEVPNCTLGDIAPLLTKKTHRRTLLSEIANEAVLHFWEEEYDRYSPAFRAVVVAPLQNKLGALLTDPRLSTILTGTGASLDLRGAMDRGEVLILNLDKGRIGEGPSMILGSFILGHIALAGLSRSDTPAIKRADFNVFVDECHVFATQSLATILAELRKYHVSMVLAHQYLTQTSSEMRDALLGNCGSILSFRPGAKDAHFLSDEMAPVFDAQDFTCLPNRHMYIRLLIDGEPSKPFSARTLDAPEDK